MSDLVRIIEVGPRDGLQNERTPIPLEAKLRFIRALAQSGLTEIEATSFVSPKWVPQLADAETLWPQLPPGPQFSALVPNHRGLTRAIDAGVRRVALFTAASDAFTLKNINMTIDQSLDLFKSMIEVFRERVSDGWIRGYVSTAFECPYQGRVTPSAVIDVATKLESLGVDEVCIGDTIGVAAPCEVRALSKALLAALPAHKVAFHFHDTHGTAVANVAEALALGFTAFDSSAGGLGGCPYAPGAAGNLATEDLVYFLQRSGFPISIDLDRLAAASLEIIAGVGRIPASKAQLAQLADSEAFPM